MKILFLVFNFAIFSNEAVDYQIGSYYGEKLPLYEGLYYAVYSGLGKLWECCDWEMKYVTLDERNRYHWHKLRKDTSNSYCTNPFYSVGTSSYYYPFCGAYSYYWSSYKLLEHSSTYGNIFIYDGSSDCLKSTKNEMMNCYDCTASDSSSCSYWYFNEYPNYKLYAKINEFQFDFPAEDLLSNYVSDINFYHSSIIDPGPVEVTETISSSIEKTETTSITHSEEVVEGSRDFEETSIKGSFGIDIKGIFNAGGEKTESFGYEYTKQNSISNSKTSEISKTIKYTIDRAIKIPPHTPIRAEGYVKWMENLNVPYRANITIYGDGPVFDNGGKLDPETIEVLLSKKNLNFENEIRRDYYSITFQVRGTMKCSLGLGTYFRIVAANTRSILYDGPASEFVTITGKGVRKESQVMKEMSKANIKNITNSKRAKKY